MRRKYIALDDLIEKTRYNEQTGRIAVFQEAIIELCPESENKLNEVNKILLDNVLGGEENSLTINRLLNLTNPQPAQGGQE